MSISSIARTKKRTGELSFATKMALYKESIGEAAFTEQHESLLNVGRMLYNRLRIDGVLPKRAKAWEKIDEQDQLKWGASANDLLTSVEAVQGSGKNSFIGGVMDAVSKIMAPNPNPPVDPTMLKVLFGPDGIDPREALAEESESMTAQ